MQKEIWKIREHKEGMSPLTELQNQTDLLCRFSGGYKPFLKWDIEENQ